MADRRNRKGGRPHATSTGITLKDNSKAHELCLTEFMRTRLIRHERTLRVYGNESCFELQSELAEKGKSVLQRLALLESDNSLPPYSHLQECDSLPLATTPVISHIASPENLQHSLALSIHSFLLSLSTLACTKNSSPTHPKSTAFPAYPKGAFLALRRLINASS